MIVSLIEIKFDSYSIETPKEYTDTFFIKKGRGIALRAYQS